MISRKDFTAEVAGLIPKEDALPPAVNEQDHSTEALSERVEETVPEVLVAEVCTTVTG